jgi:hypothetical protein
MASYIFINLHCQVEVSTEHLLPLPLMLVQQVMWVVLALGPSCM